MGARIRYVVTEAFLWVAAVAGLLAIMLAAAAYLFNISLIMFRTGSMEPTIPAGAVSVVREVHASEVQVGDVLTIDRPGQLPVTHRVTSVESGSSTEERVITMRGDANDSDDPAPYVITEAREVLWSVPGLANVVNQMGSPYVLGGVTLAASLLVGWAFWPTRVPSRTMPSAPPPPGPGSTHSEHPNPRRRRRSYSASLLLLFTTGAVGANVAVPDAAAATERDAEIVRETADSDYISLRSTYMPTQRHRMVPGDTARWDIQVSLSPPETARARTGLSMTGEFPLGVTISACDQQWTDGPASSATPRDSCPGASETLLDASNLESTGVVHWLGRFSSARDLWLRVDTRLPSDARVPTNASAIVRVHAEVAGDQLSVSPGSDAPLNQGTITDPAAREADSMAPGAGPTAPEEDPAPRDEDASVLAETGGSFIWLLTLALALIVVGRVLQRRHWAEPAANGED